jgi:outer membrane lipoprotein-sorting protein
MSVTSTRSVALAAFAAFVCLGAAADGAAAQSSSFQKQGVQQRPQNPVGAPQPDAPQQPAAPGQIRQQVQPEPSEPKPDAGAGWSTEVEQNFEEPEPEAEEAPARAQQPAPAQPAAASQSSQAEAIESVNSYFNSITHLQGTFVQVDANDDRTRGRFYVQRPGRIRFDYVAPSALRIVADGRNLSIEDLDLKTVDTYPLEKTPFRMLLAKQVDLVRDARVVNVEQTATELKVTLSDRARDSGDITLVFDRSGASLRLKEWVIDDAQGLKTRITVSNLTEGKALSADFFRPTPMTFPTLPN